MAAKRSILWFRKGLRVHDNPALVKACEGASAVQPVFVLDPVSYTHLTLPTIYSV